MTLTRRTILTALLASPTIAKAQGPLNSLPPISGKAILTVSGKIGVFNAGNQAQFDRPMLESLGMSDFVTTTPWYDGPVRFEGVRMSRLMEALAASGDMVIATALNDYETRIPTSDFIDYGVLLALKRNGEYMPVRDKGPLFIIYPYDSNPALKNQKFFSRSAWQLARIVVT